MLGNACRPFSSLLPWNPLTHDNTEIQLWNKSPAKEQSSSKVHVLPLTWGVLTARDVGAGESVRAGLRKPFWGPGYFLLMHVEFAQWRAESVPLPLIKSDGISHKTTSYTNEKSTSQLSVGTSSNNNNHMNGNNDNIITYCDRSYTICRNRMF